MSQCFILWKSTIVNAISTCHQLLYRIASKPLHIPMASGIEKTKEFFEHLYKIAKALDVDICKFFA